MKRSLILAVVFVVLLGIYWLVQSGKPVVSTERPFIQADSAKVSGLRIETRTDTVVLLKQGDNWTLNYPLSFPAAQKTVTSAIEKLKEMKKLTLITDKPERYTEFQVDSISGVRVTVDQSGAKSVFVIGKAGPSGSTCYARLDGSKEVWEISGNHLSTFKRAVKDWRDKTISEFDRESFSKFTLEYPAATINLTKQDTLWIANTGKEQFMADKGQVDRIIGLLTRMSGVDFADTLRPDAFDKPALHLIAETNDGRSLDVRLIPKDAEGNQYFLRKAGAPSDYVIYKSTATVLMKQADEFKGKPPKPAKPDQASLPRLQVDRLG